MSKTVAVLAPGSLQGGAGGVPARVSRFCKDASEAKVLLASGVCSAFVVDPTGLRTDVFDSLIDLVERAGILIVVRAHATPAGADCILRVLRRVPARIVIDDEDLDTSVEHVLRAAEVLSLPSDLLRQVGSRVASLPAPLRAAVALIFGGRRSLSSVTEFIPNALTHPLVQHTLMSTIWPSPSKAGPDPV